MEVCIYESGAVKNPAACSKAFGPKRSTFISAFLLSKAPLVSLNCTMLFASVLFAVQTVRLAVGLIPVGLIPVGLIPVDRGHFVYPRFHQSHCLFVRQTRFQTRFAVQFGLGGDRR